MCGGRARKDRKKYFLISFVSLQFICGTPCHKGDGMSDAVMAHDLDAVKRGLSDLWRKKAIMLEAVMGMCKFLALERIISECQVREWQKDMGSMLSSLLS